MDKTFQTITQKNIARLRAHPFIRRCRDGTITRSALDVFLTQQAQYSSYFTRYLCALIANLDHSDDVFQLAENLAEELGLGEGGGQPHGRLFASMLSDLGIQQQDIRMYEETAHLIDTAFHYCRQRNPAYGLGALCLGAEAIVAPLYEDIIEGFTANGIQREHLKFFQVHVDCDDEHAETMKQILCRLHAERPQDLRYILEGAHAMIDARLEFFSGILQGAEQRCH
jgi:pyrroloquinoline quinone (PQQ) biosynthesis protein C